MNKLSVWRKNPAKAGISNCVGDIGTHIEHTVSYMTGLKVKRAAAVLDSFGQPLDLNANILVEFDNGAHGVFCSSQVCVGCENFWNQRFHRSRYRWCEVYPCMRRKQ